MFAPVTRLTALVVIALSLVDSAIAIGGIANGLQAENAFSPVGKRHGGHDHGSQDPLRVLQRGNYDGFCRDYLHRPYYDGTTTSTRYSTKHQVKWTDVTRTQIKTRKADITTTIEAVTPTSTEDATTTVYTATTDVAIASTTVTADPETVTLTVVSTEIIPETVWQTATTTVTTSQAVYKRHGSHHQGIPYELKRYPSKSISSACKRILSPRTRTIKKTKYLTKTFTKTQTRHTKSTTTSTITHSTTTTPAAETTTAILSISTLSELPVTATLTETPVPITITATSTSSTTSITTSTTTKTAYTTPPAPAYSCASTQTSGRIASFYGVSAGVTYRQSAVTTHEHCCSICFNTPGCVGWRWNYPSASGCDLAVKTAGGSGGNAQCPNGTGSVASQVRNDDLSQARSGNGPCGTISFTPVN